MLTTGAQIKAARALIGWSQADLAHAAGLHENAVAYWEAKASIRCSRFHSNAGSSRIMRALAEVGVTFIAEPGPGVCFGAKAQFLDAVKGAAPLPHRPSSAAFAA